jgi:Plant phosphoribosyltransferase C-terminal/C2 domain
MATPPPAPTTRKLVVEVVDARDLLPKDGLGTSSAYAVVDFAGQRKRTKTIPRDLNPQWLERLEFIVPDPSSMALEELDVEVYNDRHLSAARHKNHFLGRVRIYGSQFSRRGEEGIVYFPLEKKNLLSWIRGEIGLKIYYYDELIPPPEDKQPDQPEGPPPSESQAPPQEPKELSEIPAPTEAAVEMQLPPPAPVVVVEESPPPYPPSHVPHVNVQPIPEPNTHVPDVMEVPDPYPPEVRKTQTTSSSERVQMPRRPHSRARTISGRFESVEPVQSAYDLVEPMKYLFVRVVKARGLLACKSPTVKVSTGTQTLRSKPARDGSTGNPEWNQVFALCNSRPESTLEISVWDSAVNLPEPFLGGVCFDLSDVPVRDQPDGPLAPQWYRLEGSEPCPAGPTGSDQITGDIMVSVWIGTQADEAFPESWNTDAPYVIYTRSKVYQSPKLWYLRASVIEAQDVRIPSPLPGMSYDVRVKIQLGFQFARTHRSTVTGSGSTFAWMEDLIFVVSEPLEEHMVLLVEDRTTKEPLLVGHTVVPVNCAEQRFDEHQMVASKWFNLESGLSHMAPSNMCANPNIIGGPNYCGRIHLRLCLEGGYHVLDEAAHLCSDYRPTAKQLWKPPVGTLELGIISARGLLPMKNKSGGKGSTDAYCVAKYGKKWVRTRTIMDSFDPKWNEQYTWQVYDPCTVLTIGVFDNWRMLANMDGENRSDYRIGKVRIRVSTLESNRAYTCSYPLLVLLRSGLKKMGEVQLAVRFMCHGQLPDIWVTYTQPLLPRMHYLRPIGVTQQEVLRGAAIHTVAIWLERSEPPLGREVVRYMLDADAHTWSVRRSKSNWFRIMGVVAWAVGLARWISSVQQWRNPVTTILIHVLYLVLVWYPELVVPTASLYVFVIGVWYYRFRPRVPAGMDVRLSQADTVEHDELEEEFDPVPGPDVIRARYERLRTLAGRVQRVIGDLAAQGERVQALVSWRDPRATRIFIGFCLVVALVLYTVPPKMVAVALGFYFMRHPMFRDPMPMPALNFFRRLPSLSDRLL